MNNVMDMNVDFLVQENVTVSRMRMLAENIMEQEGAIQHRGGEKLVQWEDTVAGCKDPNSG